MIDNKVRRTRIRRAKPLRRQMADDPDSLTLRILQELREEMRQMRSAQEATNDHIAELVQRVDGNTLVFNLMAGVVHDHEGRIEKLESR